MYTVQGRRMRVRKSHDKYQRLDQVSDFNYLECRLPLNKSIDIKVKLHKLQRLLGLTQRTLLVE